MTDPVIIGTPDSDRNLDEFDSEGGTRSAEAASPRAAVAPGASTQPIPFKRREFEGAVVAAALAAVAIGYGGLLLTSWHESAAPMPAVAAHPAVAQPSISPSPQVLPAVAVAPPDRLAATRPRAAGMNATTLNAIWRRSDTRSLQQAFARLRRETLAFHRCSMQMTGADRAVARCDGVSSQAAVHWTLDFHRSGNRWAIQRVSKR